MATPSCWRCLSRPSTSASLTPRLVPVTSAPFHTSPTSFALVPKKATGQKLQGGHIRAGKQQVIRRNKKPQPVGRPVAPGERKAFRKRIQLSNNNAIPVPGLETIVPDTFTNSESVGSMVSLPGDLVDTLRSIEAFKPTQQWGLFHSPHMLVRKETVELGRKLAETAEKKETLRLVVDGEKGSGKSILGLQALAAGHLNGWVVLHIPEAQDLTTGSTDYGPIPDTEPQLYSHPSYILKFLHTIAQSNQAVLSKEKLKLQHDLPISTTRETTLSALAAAPKDAEAAWPVFQALWKELLQPGRPPILFSLDGLHHIMKISDYRNPAYELIHSLEFAFLKTFADALGGKTRFPNGAAILGITNTSNRPQSLSVDTALNQAIAAQKGQEIPQRDPFYRDFDERVFEALKGVQVMNIRGVDRKEARAIMEYWAASGVMRTRIDERLVAEKWALAGGGVLSELEKAGLYVPKL